MEKSNNSGFKYLNKYASRYKGYYFLSILLAIFSVLCKVLPFLFVYNICNMMLLNVKDITLYYPNLIYIFSSLLLSEVFSSLSTSVSHTVTFKVISKMREDTCQKLTKIPMGYVVDKPSGELKTMLVEKIDSVEPILAHMTPELTSNLVLPLAIIVYIFITDWRMGFASLATIPLMFVFGALMFKDYEKNFTEYTNIAKKMNSTIVEYINGIKVIKAFNRSATSYKKYEDSVVNNAKCGLDWMDKAGVGMAGFFSVVPTVLISTLPIGTLLVVNNSLSLSQFILILLLDLALFTPILNAMMFFDSIAQVNVNLSDLAIIDNKEQMIRENKSLDKQNSVRMENVSFSYSDKTVLKNINIDIKKNSFAALVGPSGSGKSTIAKLIAGFWDVDDGNIYFNDTNSKEISLENLNKNIAYVSQDTFLFNQSVKDNIRQGNIKASDEDVIDVCKKAGCHDFIVKLENGYDTIVGSGGGHLSGGEKQRIAIARAMLKDASIIILDEATSYSDVENEAIIQESISKLIKDKTLIVIAHRLSTITDCDQIIVINNGLVDSCGTHQELLEKSSLYNSMYTSHINSKDKRR